MIIVTIELHPSTGGPPRLLGRGKIVNDGSGTSTTGNYRVVLEKSPEYAHSGNVGKPWKQGVVIGFPRQRLGPWDLLLRALRAAVGGRNPEPRE